MSRPKVLLLAATVLISLGILFLGGLQFFRKSHRRDIDSVGGTILAYQTADDVELSAAEQRDFGEILVKRLDPDGKRGLTVRFPNSRRVEIAIPRGEEHELFVDTVKVLMARKGSLEFLIAANETGDRDAIIETKNWFALENERHAEHETELAQRFANSQPPPTPGKDWPFAGKKTAKARYRWCRLSESFCREIKLHQPNDGNGNLFVLPADSAEQKARLQRILKDGRLEDGTKLPDEWLEAARARLAGIPFMLRGSDILVVSGGTSRAGPTTAWEYFALMREPNDDEIVTSADLIDAFPLGSDVIFSLTDAGADRMYSLTGNNLQQTMAVVLDGSLFSVAIIQGVISSHARLTCGKSTSAAEVQRLAAILMSGPMPVALKPEPVEVREVPPAR